jgi:photosystem II stability/assembly factor-like uncharacterized protein
VRIRLSFFALLVLTMALPLAAQVDPALLPSLHWRGIGPYRGGRTRAVAGVPTQPGVFYIGVCNGGVWKTDDYGRTWTPIFDQEPTGSIGAIVVAPSDPNIIYVGSGEGLHRPDLSVGDGIYKSTDGGKTWTHLGLRDGQQIPWMAVDPKNPDRLFVAVLGHPYGPNPERGIYRSLDGGKTFQKVLGKDENTGGSFVELDPSDPNTVYAAIWDAREGPWENGAWSSVGGIYKSTDGGDHWQPITKGLPEDLTQSNLAIAPTNPNRIYAAVASKHDKGIAVGLYVSNDAGASWQKLTDDDRPATRIGGGDLPVLKVDPKNPDIVYSTSIVTWRSTDGGKTWTGIRGAPGGDDYQNIWIDPNNTDTIILTSDQGAIITVNGGTTWSSWYNQPTAQLYHVNADNAFPYRVCSGQQESGSACVATRGNDGEITFREWHPVAAEEYGQVVPDPLDPDIVYGGKLSRYDRRTGQAQDILPVPFRSGEYRMLRTEPIVFSPFDPHTMYFAANTLWQTSDAGRSWKQISPDLTRKTWQAPASVGKYASEKTAQPIDRGVIYALAASPVKRDLLWAGTDDGQIWVTSANEHALKAGPLKASISTGMKWNNVTPQNMTPFQKVSVLEASHFDAQEAYAAINTLRLDDLRPHILRTRDSGKTWIEIVNGIGADENVNAVREDPKRKGLLFASTERQVYVSFDDGDHWQSLRLNMPASSVRDVAIHDDDLIAATHGRGFWVLDDITPLRQMEQKFASLAAVLYKPQTALRVRWDTNTDTPLPPDVAAGPNPPDGAILDYFLAKDASGPVVLEIKDAAGKLVRRYSSADKPEEIDPKLNIPKYWPRPPQVLSAKAGAHRWLWDMHYAPVQGMEPEYPIAAVAHETAPQPTSPWVVPGNYTVTLTVDGKTYTQPLVVKMDPRVKATNAQLAQQFRYSDQLYRDMQQLSPASNEVAAVTKQLSEVEKKATGETLAAVKAFEKKMQPLTGPGPTLSPAYAVALTPLLPGTGPFTIATAQQRVKSLFDTIQGVDDAPTKQQIAAIPPLEQQFAPMLKTWQAIKASDLPELNQKLKSAGLAEIKLEAPEPSGSGGQNRDEE